MDMQQMTNMASEKDDLQEYPTDELVHPQKTVETMIHINKITKEYMDKIENIDPSKIGGIAYQRATNLNLITKTNDKSANICIIKKITKEK